jgi:hypothetical protein
MTRISTAIDFDLWLASAPHGARATYHVGQLATDRVENDRLDTLALAVLAAADRGQVAPLSRRLGAGKFQYEVTAGRFQIAGAARAPRPAQTRLAAYGRRNVELPIAA